MKTTVSLRRCVFWLALLLPPLYLITMVGIYYVDVPFWDEWAIFLMLEKAYSGTLSFNDFWMPHNEHRLLFPKAILFVIAYVSKWNMLYEVAVNILLGSGIFFALVFLVRKTSVCIHGDGKTLSWIIPVVSFFTFSLNQWVNWFWGWQMQIFLCAFASVTGLILLSDADLKWRRFGVAAALGVVAMFSFAGGIGFWAAGIVTLCMTPCEDKKKKRLRMAAWSCLFIVLLFLYFLNFGKMDREALRVAVSQPVQYSIFILTYLGSPVSSYNVFFSFLTGALGVVFTGYIWRLAVKEWQLPFHVLVPYLSLSVFAVFNGALTASGRLNRGLEQALSYQYVTVSQLFWICILVFLHPAAVFHFENKKKRTVRKYVLTCIYAALLYLVFQNSVQGSRHAMIRNMFLARAQYAVTQPHGENEFAMLHPDLRFLKKSIPKLRKYGLSVYRKNSIRK